MTKGFERSGEKWDEDRRFLDLDLLAVDQSGFNLELKVGSGCWNTFGNGCLYFGLEEDGGSTKVCVEIDSVCVYLWKLS